jgi:sec-independent protein translocase protein TatA
MLAEIIGPDMLIVLAIALLLFGGTRIPQLARGLGEASREFRRGMEGSDEKPAETPEDTHADDK